MCWLSVEGGRKGERTRKVGVWCEIQSMKGKKENTREKEGREREREREYERVELKMM